MSNKTVNVKSIEKSTNFTRLMVIYVIPVLVIYLLWIIYMTNTSSWGLYRDNWFMAVTMMFGSFIAGSSSEGGGAVAFPVMTLVFNIEPSIARTFSLAIQSFGMTTAALLIIALKIKIEQNYLVLAGIGGIFGMIVGTFWIAPMIAPAYAKMLFTSFWMSFGAVLFWINVINKRSTVNSLPDLSKYEQYELVFIGLVGGILSSTLGSGIDICTFAFVTMKYRLSEKIATPTSVIFLASNALFGILLHQYVIDDVTSQVTNYLLVCIPVVILGAPLGSYVISFIRRVHIVMFLCFAIVLQFVTAIIVIKPTGGLLYFSIAVFLSGIILFFVLTQTNMKRSQSAIEPLQINSD